MRLKQLVEALHTEGNTAAIETYERLKSTLPKARYKPKSPPTSAPCTPELAAKIRAMYFSTDMTQREVARAFNVDQSRVSASVRGVI